jgi:hypothetical protein
VHPLAEGTRRMAAAPDQLEWAAEAGARIDALVVEAVACADLEVARDLLGRAIRELYQQTVPYRGLPMAEPWIEQTHQRLHARARELFGAAAWTVVPPLHHEPLPSGRSGPRSAFGL